MELFLLYIWLMLPSITAFFSLGALAAALFGVFHTLWMAPSEYSSEATDKRKRAVWGKWFPRIVSVFFAFLLPAVFLPSKTDVAILVGGHYALKFADTPEAAKVTSILRLKANEILDKQLEKAK